MGMRACTQAAPRQSVRAPARASSTDASRAPQLRRATTASLRSRVPCAASQLSTTGPRVLCADGRPGQTAGTGRTEGARRGVHMSQTIPRRPPVGASACARAMHSAACGQQSRAARWGMPPIALPASFALVSKAFGTASKTALATFRKTKTRGNAPCRSLRVLGHTGAPRRRRGGKGLRCAAAHTWYATLRSCRQTTALTAWGIAAAAGVVCACLVLMRGKARRGRAQGSGAGE